MVAALSIRRGVTRLGDHDFVLLWGAMTVSTLGTAVTTVALPLVALVTLHASTFQVGLVSAAGFAAWIGLGLFAGVWVDRFPRRRVLIVCDLVRAAALVSVPLAQAAHVLTLAHLIGTALVMGVGSVFFDIGLQTYVAGVIEPAKLLSSNSKLQGSDQVAQITGPALGGALVELLTAPFALLIDVASYLVSAACLVRIRTEERPPKASAQRGMVAQIREGLGYVWRHPNLRPLALAATCININEAALLTLSVVFLVRTVGTSPGLVGVLMASTGVGGLLGATFVGRFCSRVGNARALVVALIGIPATALLMPMTVAGPALLLFAVGNAGVAGFTVVFSVVARVYRQVESPPELLGRVTSVIRFVSWGVAPIGAFIGGVLGQAMGNRAALWVVCAALVTAPLPVAFSPIWRSRELTTTESVGAGSPSPAPSSSAPVPAPATTVEPDAAEAAEVT